MTKLNEMEAESYGITKHEKNCMNIDDHANDRSAFLMSAHRKPTLNRRRLIDRRSGSGTCDVIPAAGSHCRAVPRYHCSGECAHIVCGIHIQRAANGLHCPVCAATARPFVKRGPGRLGRRVG
jgi:hypothetical protein